MFLGRKVRLKQAGGVLWQNARAVVVHRHLELARPRLGADGDMAAFARRVHGIQDQVKEDLHELVAHCAERRQARR